MSLIYASLSDSTVKQQDHNALDRHLGPDVTLAGPAAQALREHRLDPEAVHWLQTNFLETELELGHCLRLPQEGPCECDLVLTCSKFVTTSDSAPRLRARLDIERQLIDEATTRGWDRESNAIRRLAAASNNYSETWERSPDAPATRHATPDRARARYRRPRRGPAAQLHAPTQGAGRGCHRRLR